MCEHSYVGKELELFAKADRWKHYWISKIRPYVSGDVLEVGAGIGANTVRLVGGAEKRWVCLEPDPKLAEELRKRVESFQGEAAIEVRVGGTSSLSRTEPFDTILYIDVLEHIENDREEIDRAASLLKPGGHLVLLSPAHQWLFSPFDKAIGHYRRYTRATLRAVIPRTLHTVKLLYLDSVGLLASTGNRFLLRESLPSAKQIFAWDKLMVRCSKFADPITGFNVGRSILGVWDKSSWFTAEGDAS